MTADQFRFYHAVRHFLTEEWGRSCAGPWWEGDLQMDFGCSLMRSLGSELAEICRPPDFLGVWPQPIMTRRLVALNHNIGAGKGTVPDFTYRPLDTDKRWYIELKLCSVGPGRLGTQIDNCIHGFEADAEKVLKEIRNSGGHGGFVLLAVNIPNSFAVPRPYTPDDFKEELIKRINTSGPLCQLATEPRGDWCGN